MENQNPDEDLDFDSSLEDSDIPPEILELRKECGCDQCTCEAGSN